MRPLLVVLAVVVVSLSGCNWGATGFAFLQTEHGLKLETWTNVPTDQREVTAKVGDVLHLSLGIADAGSGIPPHLPPPFERVTVNGEAVEVPCYDQTGDTISYVFRAQQAGDYRLEVPVFGGPPRIWHITVSL
jgi:hypothetical protein